MSNIAWSPARDGKVGEIAIAEGLQGIEIAPTKIWPDLTNVDPGEARAYGQGWEARGLPVVAVQSILFGRDDLVLFGEPGARDDFLTFVRRIVSLTAALGASVIVFGSPRNRRRGSLSEKAAWDIALPLMTEIGAAAHEEGVMFCLEPNPEAYGCDFLTCAREGADFVAAIDSPGIGLHLDAAGMTLAGDDMAAEIERCGPLLHHFHASEPNLGPVDASTSVVEHETAAMALARAGYDGFVSIEMREPDPNDGLDAVRAAQRFVANAYGSPTA